MKLVSDKSPRTTQYKIARVLSVALILAGLAVLAYPRGKIMCDNYREASIVRGWENSMALLAQNPQGQAAPSSPEELEAADEALAMNSDAFIGIMEIDKINLKSPILRGTSKDNLDVALTTIEPTGAAGAVGNMAVAGHNNFDYGRHFNRLDELAAGDIITVKSLTDSCDYVVTEKLYLNPDETEVLRQSTTEALLTLVTCYPRDTAKQRLIVKAKLVA